MGSESGSGTSNGGSGTVVAVHRVPPGHKKMVQSLKEVVNNGNYTDSEIYAVLQDCDMDPNDAVQKLLSQDTFHEVKSKRERRKEMKDTQELKGRGSSSYPTAKVYVDRSVGDVQSQANYNESGKAAYRKANGSAGPALPSSSLTYQVKTPSDRSSSHSDSFEGNSTSKNIATGVSSSQNSQVSQSAWVGGSCGHVSMADIVKMGGPHNATSPHSQLDLESDGSDRNSLKMSLPQTEVELNVQYPLPSHGSEYILQSGVHRNENGFDDQPEQRSGMDRFSTHSYMHGSGFELRADGLLDAAKLLEANDDAKDRGSDSVKSVPLGDTRDNVSHLASKHKSSSETSPPAESLQKLSLGEKSAVVFPNHIQSLAADCSHLSFGTYKPGAHSPISAPAISDSLKSNLFVAAERSPSLYVDTENFGLPRDSPRPEQLGSISNTSQLAVVGSNRDLPVQLQPESIRRNVPAATYQHDYFSQFSLPDSGFKQFQDHNTSLSTTMLPNPLDAPRLHQDQQMHLKTIPTDFLASNLESLRSHDDLRSTFGSTQPLSRYGNITSSTGSSSILIPEVLNPSAQALPMSYSQGFPGREHAPSQSFSQPALSLEDAAKLAGYGALSQNYAHRPSSLQHSYEESSAYHDSLLRMKNLTQLNGDASRSNFLQSDSNASGYGGFGRQSSYRDSSFHHDLSSNLSGSSFGYVDPFRSSVHSGNNFSSPPQNDTSSPWDYGLGTGTLSAIPDSQYHGLQGYSQSRPSYKQDQQLSQNYSAPGYGSLFPSQGSLAQEQWKGVGNAASYQDPSSKQQQIWGQNFL